MTRRVLRVSITALQPLALGTASEVSFFTGSHAFVPGSVLRGALAAAWIAEKGPPASGDSAAQFRELFDGEIRFGPLDPDGSFRVPLSVTTCKYPRGQACAATVVDLAFEPVAPCPGCGRRMAPSKGQLTLPDEARLRRVVRTSIDPKTMRVKEGELYGHDALPAGTRLTGTVFGTDGWLLKPRTLRLGGRRSVGGAADYHADEANPPAAPSTSGTLVVRLTSPAVFVDQAGRPRLDPDPDLDLPAGVRLDESWTRPLVWSGWHAASRLPKPADVCAAPGSTYRLVGDPATVDAFAQRMLDDGIGLRRAEGFGVAEIAEGPWRPPAVHAQRPAAPAEPQGGVRARLRVLRDLDLQPEQRAWLVGALRGLQIEQQRAQTSPEQATGVDKVLDELMRQPTATALTGRQREGIRTALAEVDPVTLRDLTTLAIADEGPLR
ncbi:type III-B CRISPR module-associated Cmr3 family protein [Phytohabitans aurantiacus]|uniref:CRISPR-associated protein Csx10 n=1 Tax=Phytohabitans aurantiacus TaxID=3016789 RepID=A0ABQ5R297_9ACTN|nr:type III-B CRISPR module-associated Cmr3 family protein [Phytohabitans aurantiacus]GLI00904.1 hypothetical protein Pa4123_61800 [Phytohabitans aurantiacus]